MAEKKWIQSAVPASHEGLFTAQAKKAGKGVQEFAREHQHDSGKTGARARFALRMKNLAQKKAVSES